MEDWKIKIAVLWLVFECGVIAISTLEQYIPGFIEEARTQITPELMLAFAIALLIPPVMAFLSLTLKDKANRWANIILGIVFAGFAPIGLIDFLASAFSASVILIGIVQFVAAALIVWYAWKSKQKA